MQRQVFASLYFQLLSGLSIPVYVTSLWVDFLLFLNYFTVRTPVLIFFQNKYIQAYILSELISGKRRGYKIFIIERKHIV